MKVLAFVMCCLVTIIANSGCDMMQSKEKEQHQPAQSAFDAKAVLGPRVLPNIIGYVNPAKAKVGQMAIREVAGSQEMVAGVGEKDGKKLVEISGSLLKDFASGTMCVITYQVADNGDVIKAWGGKTGGEGVALDVPAKPEIPKSSPAADGPKPKIEDLGIKDFFGFQAKGTRVEFGGTMSTSWMASDFPFFGGLMLSETGVSKVAITKYQENGAKPQLTLPAK